MDPELWDVIKRYTIVGIVLTGALVWAVSVTPIGGGKANNAPALEASTATPDLPVLLDAGVVDGKLVVVRHGLRRISCEVACDLEASCELRAKDACVNESCEGEVRKLNRSDFHLENAATCAEIVVTPCEEACWRKGECNGRHDGDAACTAACTSLMSSQPARTWRQARCVLEVKGCGDVAACDAT